MYIFASGVNFLRKKIAGTIFADLGKNRKIAKKLGPKTFRAKLNDSNFIVYT